MKVFSLVSVVLVAAIQDGNPNDRIAKIEENVQVCFLHILFVIRILLFFLIKILIIYLKIIKIWN